MPISKSAKKALRSSKNKASLNRHRKALVKAATKNVTPSNLSKAVSMIDKATKWGLFHKNKAARLKSRLNKTVGSPEPKPKAAKAAPAKKAAAKKPAAKKATAKKSK